LRARPKGIFQNLAESFANAGSRGVRSLDLIEPVDAIPLDDKINACAVLAGNLGTNVVFPEFASQATIKRFLEFVVSEITLDLVAAPSHDCRFLFRPATCPKSEVLFECLGFGAILAILLDVSVKR
jgi:hypothetical protein